MCFFLGVWSWYKYCDILGGWEPQGPEEGGYHYWTEFCSSNWRICNDKCSSNIWTSKEGFSLHILYLFVHTFATWCTIALPPLWHLEMPPYVVTSPLVCVEVAEGRGGPGGGGKQRDHYLINMLSLTKLCLDSRALFQIDLAFEFLCSSLQWPILARIWLGQLNHPPYVMPLDLQSGSSSCAILQMMCDYPGCLPQVPS